MSRRVAFFRLQTLLLVVPVFALLVCVPSWSQDAAAISKFGTKVSGGESTTCNADAYKKPKNGLTAPKDTSGHAGSGPCLGGTSDSQSDAFLGISLKSDCKQYGSSTCASSLYTFDTATLKPPKGYKKPSVPIGWESNIAVTISGVSDTTNAKVTICWIVGTGTPTCPKYIIDTKIGHVITQTDIAIPKPFVLSVTNTGMITTGATGPDPIDDGTVEAGFTTKGFHLTLPKGWTCKYASKKTCP